MIFLKMSSPPDDVVHYCLRSYRNRALNYRRSLWRRMLREMECRSWFEPASGESPLEKQAMKRLEQLPAEQKEVIVLKIWNQLTFDQIGSVAGCSPNTVAGRYRYGLEKIRKCLDGEGYEERGINDGKPIVVLDTARSFAKS